MSGITFGTPAAANTTGFNLGGGFGATSTPLGGFGGTPASTGGFGFGGFGASSAGTAPTTSSLGTGFSFGGSSLTTTMTAAAPLGFGGLGGTSLSSGASSFLGNQAVTTTTASGGLGGLGLKLPTSTTQTPSAAPLWGGLGGTDNRKSPIKSGLANASSGKANEMKTVKDNVVPPEILATVEEFSKHIKAQKLVRENIARMTARPLFKVEDDLKDLRQQLHDIAALLQKNSVGVEKLKKEATQELKHVEIAQRTKDIPPGLQYENVQPTEYFQRLVEDFEHQMSVYRQQFLDAEKFFASINHSSASNPSEFLSVFTKLNEGFINLAAKLQVVHESVKSLKENYTQFRKRQLCDTADLFKKPQNGRTGLVGTLTNTTYGPSPFSYGNSISSSAFSSALSQSHSSQHNVSAQVPFFGQQQPQQPQQQQQQQFGIFGSSPQFLNSSALTTTQAPTITMGTPPQKPGIKRGKNA